MFKKFNKNIDIHQISHCATVGTSFACDGGGRGGGQFGTLTPDFFTGGFLMLVRGGGVGRGPAPAVGGGGAWGFGGPGALCLEN